jgi:TolB-like protein/DNA-binding winged helix-turn-helix (wHTH) protein/Flp pilus assembly protein TadD
MWIVHCGRPDKTITSQKMRYQVADLLVDVAQRRVIRDGTAIELSALNFDLLRVLVEAAPNVVTYDDLAQRVWGRHFVSPENVAQRIKLLRHGLADDASEPRFIETVRGKGYRLIPSARIVPVPVAGATDVRRLPSLTATVVAAALVLGAASSVYLLGKRFADAGDDYRRAPLPSSVAILPLKNLSPDPGDAYFAAGIHEEIIGQLGKAPNLSVIAQTSVQQYANGGKSISEIAAELNVEAVMEGSVRYSDERVRVTTNLIDPATGASRWSEVYDRELGDVFMIQEDIATNIAAALGATLSPPRRTGFYGQATTSPEAAALYMKVLELQRQNSFDTAIQLQYLDSALAFDPRFANLYALKAGVYALAVVDRAGGRALKTTPAELEMLALENAAKALELDPKSTHAYLAIGAVHKFSWRWNDATRAFQSAYDLGPNDIAVLSNLAEILSWSGRHDRAISLAERAVELDPASPTSRWRLGVALAQAGRAAAAAGVLREAAAMAPTAGQIRHWLGQMEAASGNPAQALLELQAAERLGTPLTNPTLAAGLLYSYSRIGRPEDVARLAANVEALAASGLVGPGTWALTHLARGDADKAHRWLDTAVQKIERHEPDAGFLNLMTIKTNPHVNPVLDEPRFRKLRDRIGMLD